MGSDGEDYNGVDPPKKKADKRLSVERIYQKKSQLEHILLRPDTYIGSVQKVTEPMWVWEEAKPTMGDDGFPVPGSGGGGQMVKKEITYVPGFFKIFDEIYPMPLC